MSFVKVGEHMMDYTEELRNENVQIRKIQFGNSEESVNKGINIME